MKPKGEPASLPDSPFKACLGLVKGRWERVGRAVNHTLTAADFSCSPAARTGGSSWHETMRSFSCFVPVILMMFVMF